MKILKDLAAELQTYSQQLDLHNQMEEVLREDLLDCEKLASGKDKTNSGSRSFVRAVFALIEGSVFNLKQIALALSKHGKGSFSQAELVMLEEVSLGCTHFVRLKVKTLPWSIEKGACFRLDR
jgi:hypothetical protein